MSNLENVEVQNAIDSERESILASLVGSAGSAIDRASDQSAIKEYAQQLLRGERICPRVVVRGSFVAQALAFAVGTFFLDGEEPGAGNVMREQAIERAKRHFGSAWNDKIGARAIAREVRTILWERLTQGAQLVSPERDSEMRKLANLAGQSPVAQHFLARFVPKQLPAPSILDD